MTKWQITTPYDARAARVIDKHYSRAKLWPQSVGKNQFAIANSLVLAIDDGEAYEYAAVWVTKWQAVEARNDGKDAWINQVFSNDKARTGILSSQLIAEAVAISRWRWFPRLPQDGFITYIAGYCVQSTNPGFCYMKSNPAWHKLPERTVSRNLIQLVLTKEQLLEIEPMQAPVVGGLYQAKMAI